MTMCYASRGAKDGRVMPVVRVSEPRQDGLAVSGQEVGANPDDSK